MQGQQKALGPRDTAKLLIFIPLHPKPLSESEGRQSSSIQPLHAVPILQTVTSSHRLKGSFTSNFLAPGKSLLQTVLFS